MIIIMFYETFLKIMLSCSSELKILFYGFIKKLKSHNVKHNLRKMLMI